MACLTVGYHREMSRYASVDPNAKLNDLYPRVLIRFVPSPGRLTPNARQRSCSYLQTSFLSLVSISFVLMFIARS